MVMVPGGVAPLHSHPGGTELIFVIEGSVVSGFISATLNRVYTKTLDNPGLQILDFALFANDLPTEVVNKVTNLDELQIVKLKALFGGRG
uniref:Cupin type-1 domain-containing protein n=1 Tax=Zea mays TaxID=4577 RepID=A0A804N405_MAIZE